LLGTWHIAFRHHDLINPSSPDKIRTLGARMGLAPDTTVLDLACGTGGPAVLLAAEYGCRIVGVDHHALFLEWARARAHAAGVAHLIDFVEDDGAEFIDRNRQSFDAALCIGAAWILGGFAPTAARLSALVPFGGHVAIGDTYRQGSGPWRDDAPGHSLAELVNTLADLGLAPITVLAASQDDWNTYHSLMWLSIEDWLLENPDHPEANRFRDHRSRGSDLAEQQDGWAIIAGRQVGEL
jgi:SAM-dependent methyltransferase